MRRHFWVINYSNEPTHNQHNICCWILHQLYPQLRIVNLNEVTWLNWGWDGDRSADVWILPKYWLFLLIWCMASRLFQWLQILVNKAYPFFYRYVYLHFIFWYISIQTNKYILVLTLSEVHLPPPITYSYLVFASQGPARVDGNLFS